MHRSDDVLTMLSGAVLAISAKMLGWLDVHQWWMEAGSSLLLGGVAAVGGHFTRLGINKYISKRKKTTTRK